MRGNEICMCDGNKCPIKKNCYRFTATPGTIGQDWIDEAPYNPTTEKCDEYWPLKKENKIEK